MIASDTKKSLTGQVIKKLQSSSTTMVIKRGERRVKIRLLLSINAATDDQIDKFAQISFGSGKVSLLTTANQWQCFESCNERDPKWLGGLEWLWKPVWLECFPAHLLVADQDQRVALKATYVWPWRWGAVVPLIGFGGTCGVSLRQKQWTSARLGRCMHNCSVSKSSRFIHTFSGMMIRKNNNVYPKCVQAIKTSGQIWVYLIRTGLLLFLDINGEKNKVFFVRPRTALPIRLRNKRTMIAKQCVQK